MPFLSELWLFMRVRKKFWLMPIFFMVVPLGGLMVLLTKGSVKIKEWNLLKEEFDAWCVMDFLSREARRFLGGRGCRAFITADTDR
jgi:hypothetical protein